MYLPEMLFCIVCFSIPPYQKKKKKGNKRNKAKVEDALCLTPGANFEEVTDWLQQFRENMGEDECQGNQEIRRAYKTPASQWNTETMTQA